VNELDCDQSGVSDGEQHNIMGFPEHAELTAYNIAGLSKTNYSDESEEHHQFETSRIIPEAGIKNKPRKKWGSSAHCVKHSLLRDSDRYLHMPMRIPKTACQMNPRKRCSQCWKMKKRSDTYWQCSVCSVGLHPNCFEQYHTFK
jgi:hypothetical protein